MTAPAVTVLIDTYKHARFIEQAISSVLAQDFAADEFEIVVVDDGSADATSGLVRAFGDRVRLIEKQNGGQASAFNTGIAAARGEIIVFLDGDDWWAPTKLTCVVEYFRAHLEVGVLGHGIYQADTVTGTTVRTAPSEPREIDFRVPQDAAFFRQSMCFFGTSRLAMRRSVALRALPVPESIVIEADEFLAIFGTACSRAALIPDPLTYYRLHEDNLYQIRSVDPRKLRRMQLSLEALARELPPRLAQSGLQERAIETLVAPLNLSARRIRLSLDGGMPWHTFAAERAERAAVYTGRSTGYRVFETFSLALALVLPPRLYYRLRHWYAASYLRQWRHVLGEPQLASRIQNVPVGEISPKPGRILPIRYV